MNIFDFLNPISEDLFFRKNDVNDVRLGEIVVAESYERSDVVIVGCPQDEGVRRNRGRTGAALAPDKIREQFYKLTPLGISTKIFDAGNTKIAATLEQTHELHSAIVSQFLRDGKKIICLGGGNDISFADGYAMAKIFGKENWFAFNIDAHFDVRAEKQRNSGTPYRQLLENNFLQPQNFYEMCYQPQVNSPVYLEYLKKTGVGYLSLDEICSGDFIGSFEKILQNSKCENIFWGFDVDAVRASDAPGVSAVNPLGISATDFCRIVELAGKNSNTRIVEFTEINPNFDIDNRTSKLVAVAIHKFCSSTKEKRL